VPKKFQNRHSNPLNFDKKVFLPIVSISKTRPKSTQNSRQTSLIFIKKNQNLTFVARGLCPQQKTCPAHAQNLACHISIKNPFEKTD
jgi:hypothetical protein